MRKKRKRGFTLIELLAVIVILGIIAVISVPVVGNVITEAKKGSFKSSTLSLFDAYTNYEIEHGLEIKEEIPIFDLDITNKGNFKSGKIYRNKEGSIKVENVSNGVYCISGEKENLQMIEGSCDLLDETPPIIVSVTKEITTSSIKLYTTYLEEESFIEKHEYRISKENEDIEEKEWVGGDSLTANLSTKTFSNLEQGVTYKIQIRLTNTSLENKVSKIYEMEVTILNIEKPVITLVTNEEYATRKEIKITYPIGTGLIYEYSVDGNTWNTTEEVEKTITMEENSTVRARVKDGVNTVEAETLVISGIDKTKPVITLNKEVIEDKGVLTVSIEPESTSSGYRYTWYKDENRLEEETRNTLNITTSGMYKVKVTTGAGVESNEESVNAYTITYNLNGGTGTILNGIKIEGFSTNITNTTPTREGYIFVGWGISSTDKEPTYTSGATYTKNENITLYAVFKKGYTITFVENGATLSKKTESCEIFNNETSCTITTPTITRSGYTIVGFGESEGAKTSVVGGNSSLSVTGNKTYYAVTSKVFTANFNNNTVSSISATSSNCTIYNRETSCTPSLPTITPQTNFTNNGWGTSAGQTSNGVTSIDLTEANTGSTWYALNSRRLTWKFDKGSVASISKTTDGCTIYNINGTCEITAPTITAVSGYTQNGFGINNTDTSATVAQSEKIQLSNNSTGGTYYGLQKKTITITYNGNGAESGNVTSQSCTMYNANSSCAITLNSNGYTRTGYSFQGYGTNTSSVSYNAGTSYNFTNSTTLYAIWEKIIASMITYDDSKTSMGCSNVQCALDKLYEKSR